MGQLVWFSRVDECGMILVSNPPVNSLNRGVVDGIMESLQTAKQDTSAKAIILTTIGNTFISGADIGEFRKAASARKKLESLLHPLLLAIEDCPKPVVCAIHGAALGGGLEIAMACHYRVAAAGAQFGFPEVNLGLIPGGGGTQRLPRLAGLAKAAEMCSEGNTIGAADAFQSGIVDRVIGQELLPGAIYFAGELISIGCPLRKTREMSEKLGSSEENAHILEAARESARKRRRGQMAPLKAIDAIEAAATLPFEEGCRYENHLLNECLASDESRALIHVSFAEREIAKVPGIDQHQAVHVRKAAVVGAGNMGTGIAMAYANAGIPVLLKDSSPVLLEKGMLQIRKTYESSVAKERMSGETARQCVERIRPVESYEFFGDVDIVVEAVFEELSLKRQIFKDISAATRADAILASNTSSLDIDQIAAASPNPSRVVGHHFFAPANIMQLVEIVRGRATSPQVIASSMVLAKRLNKVGVVVGNCRGFAGNRMYLQYQHEAQFLIEEGAEIRAVDKALYDFGMAMGPFATRDISGLDTAWRIQKEYAASGFEETRQPLVLERLYRMGRLGQKAGAGWYRYEKGGRDPIPDPEVEQIVVECAEQAGIKRRPVSSAEILERTLFALINEGAKILEEGIVHRSVSLDIIFIMGYGFPAHKGGPMWFADRLGLKTLARRLEEFEERFGRHWRPAPLLLSLAERGSSFAEFDRREV